MRRSHSSSNYPHGAAVDDVGHGCADELSYPEGVPYAGGADEPREQVGHGYDYNNVAAQGYEQGCGALAQTLQRAGAGNAHGGDNKPGAYDAQGCLARAVVSSFSAKSEASWPGMARNITVPSAMKAADRISTSL